MNFNGFNEEDFNTFLIEGLADRMEAIQTRIQPKFKDIGSELVNDLSMKLGNELFLHIARHARRTVNPPNDTWLAIADNKRGYKKHPHFQVGLFDDRLFIWLALIYELPSKANIAQAFLNHYEDIKQLPGDFVVSQDHMKKEAIPLSELDEAHIIRFRDVKKAEFLIGRQLSKDSGLVNDGEKLVEMIKDTYQELIPFYRLAMSSR